MAEIHPARLPIESLLEECSVKRTRGSGPGGQHRNKVETAIVITHEPTGVVGQASEKRSQNRNKEAAIIRLRVNLAIGVRTQCDADQPLSDLWKSRVKSKRIQVNVGHADFPALLSEALDRLELFELDLGNTAKSLGVSSSQLVKFLKLESAAFEYVNRERERTGLHRLK